MQPTSYNTAAALSFVPASEGGLSHLVFLMFLDYFLLSFLSVCVLCFLSSTLRKCRCLKVLFEINLTLLEAESFLRSGREREREREKKKPNKFESLRLKKKKKKKKSQGFVFLFRNHTTISNQQDTWQAMQKSALTSMTFNQRDDSCAMQCRLYCDNYEACSII